MCFAFVLCVFWAFVHSFVPGFFWYFFCQILLFCTLVFVPLFLYSCFCTFFFLLTFFFSCTFYFVFTPLEALLFRKNFVLETICQHACYDRGSSLFFRDSSMILGALRPPKNWFEKKLKPLTGDEKNLYTTIIMQKKRQISDDFGLKRPVIQEPFSPKKGIP